MKEIENKHIDIVRLFLEKLEKLTEEERHILIKTINILNYPLFISNIKK